MAGFNDNNVDIKLDPDYFVPKEEEDTGEKNIFEETARSSTVNKISTILEKEFMKEIESKKAELNEIYKTLNRATKTMHYLRYAIVADYYNRDKCMDTSQFPMQARPHPTVNAPKRTLPYEDMVDKYTCCDDLGIITETKRLAAEQSSSGSLVVIKKEDNVASDESMIIDKPGTSKEVVSLPTGINSNSKIKKTIIVGNISKWIDPQFRGKNNASYKWTIYVEDTEKSDLSSIISKVRFFLHPSYKPHDMIEVSTSPFHLVRFGWGEFPVRVQLHFVNGINKPVDIIHQLKLDQTFTGLQTFGAQTVVELIISARGLTPMPTVINQEDSLEKDCDNSCVESRLTLLLKNRIKDKQSNVTIHHDLPMDHDYVNINPKPSMEPSIDLNSQENEDHTETNNPQNGNPTTVNLTQVPLLQKKTEPKKIKLELQNSKNVKKNSSMANNSKPSKYLSKNEITEALVHLINHTKPDNLANILKIIASKTPMITEKALNPSYKAQHPYASESYLVYSSYSKAKQISMERQRAIRALGILSKSKHKTDLSTKDFMMWARKYGYSPVDSTMCESKMNKVINVDDDEVEKIEMSSTILEETNQWIRELENKSHRSKVDNESNEEIDVLGLEPVSKLEEIKETQVKEPPILLEYPETKNNLLEYVRKVTDKRGIKLPPEDIYKGVLHSTSSSIITKAVECLMDEILRLSHSCAIERCKNDIDVDDVRMALLKRDKFEILTNSGLGADE